jgi:hypothetical protein
MLYAMHKAPMGYVLSNNGRDTNMTYAVCVRENHTVYYTVGHGLHNALGILAGHILWKIRMNKIPVGLILYKVEWEVGRGNPMGGMFKCHNASSQIALLGYAFILSYPCWCEKYFSTIT